MHKLKPCILAVHKCWFLYLSLFSITSFCGCCYFFLLLFVYYFVNLDIVFFSVLLWHGSRFGMVSRIPAQNFFSSFYLTKSKIIPLRYPEQGKFLLSIELRHFLPWELKSNALWLSGMKKKKEEKEDKKLRFSGKCKFNIWHYIEHSLNIC